MGEKPLHSMSSSKDELHLLVLSKLMLKSPIIIVLLLGLMDDKILESDSLKFFTEPFGGLYTTPSKIGFRLFTTFTKSVSMSSDHTDKDSFFVNVIEL